jgi:uncharacterized protein (DUF934 family)
MPKLIKNGRVVADDRSLLTLTAGGISADAVIPSGPVLVPLPVWLAHRDTLAARAASGELGVWLDAGEDPVALADDLTRLAVIAINFPKFTDGRGYSSATQLRTQLGYTGELRAVGVVLRDQFNYLTRCGFDALQPPTDRYSDAELEAAVASIRDFTEPYQGAVTPGQPLFRRARRAA